MIKSLHIRNYALISEIDIDFGQGFNIITGETGAGKSIILGALSLLLGGRADAKVIADGERKSVIEAEFSVENPDDFRAFFEENDLDVDGDKIILRRELAPNGRSRAFINDSPVTLTVLRDLAVRLVDIHSQHQNLLLADGRYQLQIIDCLADNEKLLVEYKKAYADYQRVLKNYVETRDMISRGRDEADFLNYQLKELVELDVAEGEQQQLEAERDALVNTTQTKALIFEAVEPFSGEENVVERLDRSVDALNDLSEIADESSALAKRLEAVLIELRDIGASIEEYDAEYNADPQRLEYIEERLRKIYSLETKHHVESGEGLIELKDKLSRQLDAIANGDSVMAELEAKAKKAKKAAMLIARQLSESRQATAKYFADQLKESALPLGMKNLRCEISVTSGKLTPTGIDTVDFLFAFNKNQALMPVGQTASGGEISRLMLSVKSIVGEKMNLPSIIFDEIDTGVSGDVASRMGKLMKTLSKRIQVITITHLPQVAAKGDNHYKVYKEDDEQSTNTRIRRLDNTQREGELALMLSGSADNEAAIATAKTLLND